MRCPLTSATSRSGGKNDIGKSTIFDALAIFFEEAKIECEDASISGAKEDVRIICEFDDLPASLVIDTDYRRPSSPSIFSMQKAAWKSIRCTTAPRKPRSLLHLPLPITQAPKGGRICSISRTLNSKPVLSS